MSAANTCDFQFISQYHVFSLARIATIDFLEESPFSENRNSWVVMKTESEEEMGKRNLKLTWQR